MIFRNFESYKDAKEYALKKAEPILSRVRSSSNEKNFIVSLKKLSVSFLKNCFFEFFSLCFVCSFVFFYFSYSYFNSHG